MTEKEINEEVRAVAVFCLVVGFILVVVALFLITSPAYAQDATTTPMGTLTPFPTNTTPTPQAGSGCPQTLPQNYTADFFQKCRACFSDLDPSGSVTQTVTPTPTITPTQNTPTVTPTRTAQATLLNCSYGSPSPNNGICTVLDSRNIKITFASGNSSDTRDAWYNSTAGTIYIHNTGYVDQWMTYSGTFKGEFWDWNNFTVPNYMLDRVYPNVASGTTYRRYLDDYNYYRVATGYKRLRWVFSRVESGGDKNYNAAAHVVYISLDPFPVTTPTAAPTQTPTKTPICVPPTEFKEITSSNLTNEFFSGLEKKNDGLTSYYRVFPYNNGLPIPAEEKRLFLKEFTINLNLSGSTYFLFEPSAVDVPIFYGTHQIRVYDASNNIIASGTTTAGASSINGASYAKSSVSKITVEMIDDGLDHQFSARGISIDGCQQVICPDIDLSLEDAPFGVTGAKWLDDLWQCKPLIRGFSVYDVHQLFLVPYHALGITWFDDMFADWDTKLQSVDICLKYYVIPKIKILNLEIPVTSILGFYLAVLVIKNLKLV